MNKKTSRNGSREGSGETCCVHGSNWEKPHVLWVRMEDFILVLGGEFIKLECAMTRSVVYKENSRHTEAGMGWDIGRYRGSTKISPVATAVLNEREQEGA